jgi:hypothetical protein
MVFIFAKKNHCFKAFFCRTVRFMMTRVDSEKGKRKQKISLLVIYICNADKE